MEVGGKSVGQIGVGVVVLAGITHADGESDLQLVADKVLNLRIFPSQDGAGHFERSLIDYGGEILLVSQFTLYASIRKGRRPGFTDATPSATAQPLFDRFADILMAGGAKLSTGIFGADMDLKLVNWGPATFSLDSAELKLPRRS